MKTLALLCRIGVALVCLAAVSVRAETLESYLGVRTQSNGNVLEAENAYQGITVTDVVENSPAQLAGLRPGDILLEANGTPLTHPDRLDDLLDALEPGSLLRLRVERDRLVIEREVRTVQRLPKLEPSTPSDVGATATTRVERRRLGFELRDADPERLAQLGLSPRTGVEVQRVATRSPLRQAGIEPGALLLEVDGEPIPSASDLVGYLDSLREVERLTFGVWDAQRGKRDVEVELYRPERSVTRVSVPLLFSMTRGPDVSEYEALGGAFRLTRLETGSRVRLLWLFSFETGSLEELIDESGEAK